eukprot:superscaffoldBa00000727_g6820
METISLDKSALKAVDEYWEYRRIVGDDDGGKLFTPEQYEEYKRKVLPQRVKNRLYVSFGVPGGTCTGFQSSYICGCGQPSSAHLTLASRVNTGQPCVETKLEREAQGRPVGRDVPYAAMGGLTGFSSLLDGYLALEASGSDQDREDGCQQRCSALKINQASTKASSSVHCKMTNKQ